MILSIRSEASYTNKPVSKFKEVKIVQVEKCEGKRRSRKRVHKMFVGENLSRRSSAGGRGVRVQTLFGSAPPLQARREWGVAPCARCKQGAETGGGVYKVVEAQERDEG